MQTFSTLSWDASNFGYQKSEMRPTKIVRTAGVIASWKGGGGGKEGRVKRGGERLLLFLTRQTNGMYICINDLWTCSKPELAALSSRRVVWIYRALRTLTSKAYSCQKEGLGLGYCPNPTPPAASLRFDWLWTLQQTGMVFTEHMHSTLCVLLTCHLGAQDSVAYKRYEKSTSTKEVTDIY